MTLYPYLFKLNQPHWGGSTINDALILTPSTTDISIHHTSHIQNAATGGVGMQMDSHAIPLELSCGKVAAKFVLEGHLENLAAA